MPITAFPIATTTATANLITSTPTGVVTATNVQTAINQLASRIVVSGINVKDYGAVGDGVTDDTAAIQAAINAAIAAFGGTVYLPTGIYKISSALTVNSAFYPVSIFGAGTNNTRIQQSANAHGIVFDCGTTFHRGGGVSDITIEAGTGYVSGGLQQKFSDGGGLVLQQIVGFGRFQNVCITNFAYGVIMDGCWDSVFDNICVLYYSSAGLYLNANAAIAASGSNRFTNWFISNNGYSAGAPTTAAGLQIFKTGGEQFTTIEITEAATGVVLLPTGGSSILYLFMTNVIADSSLFNGWVFDTTNGSIISFMAVDCWSSFNGENGILFKGVSANYNAITFMGARIRENKQCGMLFQASKNIRFIGGEVNSNSRTNNNVYDGISVAAGISNWSLINMQIGNNASSSSDQANGIDVDVGATDNIVIIGCDLRNFGAGKVPITENATGTNQIVTGNLPLQGSNYIVPIAVASLPTASTVTGMRLVASNANATTFAAVVAGGGANVIPVYSDGTNWRIG